MLLIGAFKRIAKTGREADDELMMMMMMNRI